jgi:hypothetical protein
MPKSNLFKQNDLARSDGFKADILAMSELPADVLPRVAPYALKSLEVPTSAEAKAVHKEAAESLGIPLSLLDHAIRVGRFFLEQFAPKGDANEDSPDNLMSDIVANFELPKDKQAAYLELLASLKTLAHDSVRMTLLRRAHEETMLPNLRSVGVCTDIRAVFEENYSYETDVAQYAPKLVGTVPLGIVRLGLSGADNEVVAIQLSKRSLQVLIDNLVALQKQIAEAEAHVRNSAAE